LDFLAVFLRLLPPLVGAELNGFDMPKKVDGSSLAGVAAAGGVAGGVAAGGVAAGGVAAGGVAAGVAAGGLFFGPTSETTGSPPHLFFIIFFICFIESFLERRAIIYIN
jgi:hypothetical protein